MSWLAGILQYMHTTPVHDVPTATASGDRRSRTAGRCEVSGVQLDPPRARIAGRPLCDGRPARDARTGSGSRGHRHHGDDRHVRVSFSRCHGGIAGVTHDHRHDQHECGRARLDADVFALQRTRGAASPRGSAIRCGLQTSRSHLCQSDGLSRHARDRHRARRTRCHRTMRRMCREASSSESGRLSAA